MILGAIETQATTFPTLALCISAPLSASSIRNFFFTFVEIGTDSFPGSTATISLYERRRSITGESSWLALRGRERGEGFDGDVGVEIGEGDEAGKAWWDGGGGGCSC